MSIRKLKTLPLPAAADRPKCLFEPSEEALSKWTAGLRMEAASAANEIDILDFIGQDWLGEGITTESVIAQLRAIGDGPVVVNVNSPGGEFFEGIGIHNALVAHKGEVTVNVLGIAASAASVIAMAGDKIVMNKTSFIMIHNTWLMAMGDRNDLAGVMEMLAQFDLVSAELYAERSGQSVEDVADMMDAETFLSGSKAVELGFADSITEAATKVDAKQSASPLRTMQAALSKADLTRSQQRTLISQFMAAKLSAGGNGGTPRAPGDGQPGAAGGEEAALNRLQNFLDSFKI